MITTCSKCTVRRPSKIAVNYWFSQNKIIVNSDKFFFFKTEKKYFRLPVNSNDIESKIHKISGIDT